MRARSLIRGKNFSGRSDLLASLLMRCPNAEKRFFIGPFGESSLSGLAASVREELSLYGVPAPRCPWDILLSSKSYQAVASLSGGEQALLALACSTAPHLSIVGIDSALEQLDGGMRAVALNFLEEQNCHDTLLIDNRLRKAQSDQFEIIDLPDRQSEFRIHLREASARYQVSSPSIQLHRISFSYTKRVQIFCDTSVTLDPTNIYRLVGPNGAGKSTLLKLLCGVLLPSSGQVLLNGTPYSPFESGNRLVALASQNPDDQWVDVNLRSDFTAKWAATQRNPTTSKEEAEARLNSIAAGLGVSDPAKVHLLDYPRAQRKRLSWVWPLSGAMPWLALDEPTLGQDDEAIRQIAEALELLSENGHGCILISHDERLFQLLRHKRLLIVDHQLELE